MLGGLVAALVAGLAPPAVADTADVYYARGVQAFYDEDWRRAEAYFSRAVSYAADRPHAHYFLGVTRARMGRPIEADAALRRGALAEAGKGRDSRLGAAVARLAGEDRRRLDEVRAEMLSDLPLRADSPGLPAANERRVAALRPAFRLPVAALARLDAPADLANMVAASRQRLADGPLLAGPVLAGAAGLGPEPEATAAAQGPADADADPAYDDAEYEASGADGFGVDAMAGAAGADAAGGPAGDAEPGRASMKAGAIAGLFGKSVGGLFSWIPKSAGLPGGEPRPPAGDEGDPFADEQPGSGQPGGGSAAAGGGDDPFAAGGDDDPFAEPPAPTGPPAGDEGDPFADDPFTDDTAPDNSSEAEDPPAAGPSGDDPFDDPFGDSPMDDDPFAE
ncbi:MAG: hypothetical protein AAF790_01940 [Planctomycetota bacterium]